MLTRIDLRDTDPDARDLAAILPRADLDVAAALEAVAPLIEDERTRRYTAPGGARVGPPAARR